MLYNATDICVTEDLMWYVIVSITGLVHGTDTRLHMQGGIWGWDWDSISADLPDNAFAHAFDKANIIVTLRFVDSFWRLKRFLHIGSEALLEKYMRVVDEFTCDMIRKRKAEIVGDRADGTRNKVVFFSFNMHAYSNFHVIICWYITQVHMWFMHEMEVIDAFRFNNLIRMFESKFSWIFM